MATDRGEERRRNLSLLPWWILLVIGGVLLFLNGLDPTGSVLMLAGLLGAAVSTIRTRWTGAGARAARRLREWLRPR